MFITQTGSLSKESTLRIETILTLSLDIIKRGGAVNTSLRGWLEGKAALQRNLNGLKEQCEV